MKPKFFSRKIFEKRSNIKFHKNPCSGSQVVPGGRKDRQTRTKLIIALLKFTKGPKYR